MTPLIALVSTALILELLTLAARSLVLAGVAAAALAAFRARSTSLRLFVWTSVLYASVALPVFVWLLPPLPFSEPEFLQKHLAPSELTNKTASPYLVSAAPRGAARDHDFSRIASTPYKLESHSPAGVPAHRNETRLRDSSLPFALHWQEFAAGIYLLTMAFFLLRFAAGMVLSRKLVRCSRPITGPLTIKTLSSSRLSGNPRLAVSEWISVPITVGFLRPTILLPADWRGWESEKFEAVLAHELSHVRRHDALTQHLALFYRAVFWFNPLAWWLNRQLAALAEEASDEAALSCGADQNHYARTLLGFFESLHAAPGRIHWQGVSIARPGQAERRLERILGWKGTVTMHVKRSIAIVILALAVPVVYFTASVRASSAVSQAAPPAPPQAAPPAPASAPVSGVAALAPVPGVPGRVAAGVPALAPIAPALPGAPAAPPVLAQSHQSFTSHGDGYSYAYGFDDEGERFVIVSGKSDNFTMSGSSQDARHAQKLKKQVPGDFIWFQRDEKSYIIRDQATVDRARALWAPQEELGKKQEELGKQQEALGKQQEELGKKMEQVRINVPDMTAELDRLKAKLQKLGPTATMEQMGELQSEIGELQSKIGDLQSQAGEQQGKFGEEQGKLGEQQGKLGEQQGELGRQQAELAEKATRQMKALLDEAIKSRTAKPEDEVVKGPSL